MTARADRIISHLRQPVAPRPAAPPALETNPLQTALDDYHRMAAEVEMVRAHSRDLVSENHKLVSEVNMLREALERSDSDRIRLQAVSSTLTGQLMAINAVIAESMRMAIKHGIEAVDKAQTDEGLEQAGQEAQGILQRVEPMEPPQTPAALKPPQRAPEALGGAAIEPIRWQPGT